MRIVALLVTALLFGPSAHADSQQTVLDAIQTQCPIIAATGLPTLTAPAKTQLVCHTAYAADVDLDRLVPRWVAYPLTGAHSLGCFARQNNFHADDALPPDHRATPKDYSKSGYDIGHQAPAQDFGWSAETESQSFALSNMAPQLPGLNRQGWEGLEQAVRDWSLSRDLVVYVGPIVTDSDTSIGPHHVDVPAAGFWKVVVDLKTEEALAFIMPQQDIAKGDLHPWQVSIGEVEQRAGVHLPVLIDRTSKADIWPAEDSAWHAAHKKACGSP